MGETVAVRYPKTAQGQLEERLDEARIWEGDSSFRGWGEGDAVWVLDGDKEVKQVTVTKVSKDKIVRDGSIEADGLPGRALISDVSGKRYFGWAERHGVRTGWTRVSKHEDEDSTTHVYEGVVDMFVCASAGQMRAEVRQVTIDRFDTGARKPQEVLKLVQLRNPHLTRSRIRGRWAGERAQGLWARNPGVAYALNFQPHADSDEDATFWMEYDEFVQGFRNIYITPFDASTFDPPPPECNTDWGASHYKPNDLRNSIKLDWGSHKPGNDYCAWCSMRARLKTGVQRILTIGAQKCEKAWDSDLSEEFDGVKAWQGKSHKLCCRVNGRRVSL